MVLIYIFCPPPLLLLRLFTDLVSKWCVMEITEARERDIPVICVVDTDKQPVRQVVDGYMEQVRQTTSLHLARAAVTLSFAQGFGWIFDEQVISYSTQSREHSYT